MSTADEPRPVEGIVGRSCTINRAGDLYMLSEARPFIGAACVVLKITKSGLVQVSLKENPKMVYSFPKRNVDLAPNAALEGRGE